MLTRFKKTFSDIKNDITNKIDHLEVDKNHIVNIISDRNADFNFNGLEYFLRKEENLLNIQIISKANTQDCLNADQAVKTCLLRATNLSHSMRLLEKELSSVFKLITSFATVIDDIEEKSVFIESSLIDMEKAYEEYYSKLEKENQEKKQLSKSEDLEDFLLTDGDITLEDKKFKLSLTLDD